MLHELLQALGDRALAAADGAQQVEDLLFLFEALGRMPEVGNHLFDGLFHAIELLERRIDLDDLVGEDAREPRVVAGVDHLRFADRFEHAFGGGGKRDRLALADIEIVLQRQDFLTGPLVASGEVAHHVHAITSIESTGRLRSRTKNLRNERMRRKKLPIASSISRSTN